MPIQVDTKVHGQRIKELVKAAKRSADAPWTSERLAAYVNEHYGGRVTFKTRWKDRGNLLKWLTNNGLVDDDAKVGNNSKAAYGVTDLADASMSDLTQPLYEDPHDPEKRTGWCSVYVDWRVPMPGRSFSVNSRRFDTQRKAYVHAVSMLANMARHKGQADKIDFAAVDPNDRRLRHDVLAAVQKMGARTEAEPPQEPRRGIYPGVSAVKMERDGTRVVYATPPSGGRRERFLATDIEDAKRYADQNVDVQKLAKNREVAEEIATGKITRTEAAVGKRAPSPVAEAPLLDEENDATAPPPTEDDSDDEPLERLTAFDSWEEFKAARAAAAESPEDDDATMAPPPREVEAERATAQRLAAAATEAAIREAYAREQAAAQGETAAPAPPAPVEADRTEMDVEPSLDDAAAPPSEPAAAPSPPNGPDRDTAGSAGAARHAHPTDARAPALGLPPRLNGTAARADDAAAPRAETLAAVRAERDALRDENKALQDLLTRRNYEVDFLRQQLAANGISVPDSGVEVDLGSVAFGSRDYDVACDAAARRLLPPKLALATEDFRSVLAEEEENHAMACELMGLDNVVVRFVVHAHITEMLWLAAGTRIAAEALHARALRDIGQFDYRRLVERVNALAVATGLMRRFIERRLDARLPENEDARYYVTSGAYWRLDYMIPGPEVTVAGLVLRPTNFVYQWHSNLNLDEMVRYVGYGRFGTAATMVSHVSAAARDDERVGAQPVYEP